MIEAATDTKTLAEKVRRPEYKRSHRDYMAMLDDWRNAGVENRRHQEIDEDYYHGKQLTVDEKRVLSQCGQPDIVVNRTRVAINGLLGVIVGSKSDPRCFPRTPKDQDSSDVATDVLRFVAQENRWNQIKARCAFDMLVPGVTAAISRVDKDRRIVMEQIRREEFFWDPRSRRIDFKDAAYMGIARWAYVNDVKGMYPGAEIQDSWSYVESIGASADKTHDDRPVDSTAASGNAWLDRKNRRVMIVEVYHRYEGKWYKCVFYGGGVLEEVESPFQDDRKRPCNPIEATTGYVDSDNNRYGLVRDMRDIQDEINKRRSKLLHLVSSHQIQARDPSAVEVDAETARAEASRPDGVLPFGWEVVRTTDMSAGQMQLLAESKNEMERLGPNPAVLGRQGSDTSGRAILARQQAGIVELALILDQLDDWELRCFKQIWWRAKQYWRDEEWIRVSDNPDDVKFIQLNRPKGEVIGQDEQGNPVEGPPQYDADGLSVFGYENDVAQMDIDIILDTQPETANIMQEMLQDLIKLVSSNPRYADEVPFEMFLELSPLPRKRMVKDLLKAHKQQMGAQQQEQQQAQIQAAMEKHAAEVRKLLSEAFKNFATGQAALADKGAATPETADASQDMALLASEQIESQAEREHEAIQAEADRLHESNEAALDREHEAMLHLSDQAQNAEQSQLDREASAEEAARQADDAGE